MTKDDFTYDPEGRSAYLNIVADIPFGGVTKTVPITDAVNLDYDCDGNLVGIELLYVDRDPRTFG